MQTKIFLGLFAFSFCVQTDLQPYNAKLYGAPPTLRIISPRNGSIVTGTRVRIRYRVMTEDGPPPHKLNVWIDGIPTQEKHSIPLPASRITRPFIASLDLEVPSRDCRITLIAEDRNGVSEPAKLNLKRVASPQTKL